MLLLSPMILKKRFQNKSSQEYKKFSLIILFKNVISIVKIIIQITQYKTTKFKYNINS